MVIRRRTRTFRKNRKFHFPRRSRIFLFPKRANDLLRLSFQSRFPLKRTFLLCACLCDVMIAFELSLDSSGYLYQLPCRCTSQETRRNQFDGKSFVHSSLAEYLSVPLGNLRLNHLDETQTFQSIKELNKIARVLQQMAFDVNERHSVRLYP